MDHGSSAAHRAFNPPARFELVRLIGEGGLGVVYEAHDREHDTRVALKTLRTVTGEALLRLKREFRALQDVRHRNLVSYGELIGEGGQWFFTMELVDGVDFVSYVRPTGKSGGFDERRLRSALAQLTDVLAVLHEHRRVHRDVKPSNVLVTRDDRLVLLDFGVVLDDDWRRDTTGHMDIVGTPQYMAPEQAIESRVGPEADMYSLGVVLFESLTGGPPFVGSSFAVLSERQSKEPPPPSTRAKGVPEDLDQICVELLRIEPAARPTAAQLHARLVPGGSMRPPARLSTMSGSLSSPFVGRERELEALREAFRTVERGERLVVAVQGESGIGKSCLLRHFLDELALRERGVLVLAGRCDERESVPYKALDGIIDVASKHLAHLSTSEARHLRPLNAALLVQVFPVLRRVEAFAQAPPPPHAALDPYEIRRRVFLAARELMARLSSSHSLVLAIDDFQWVDADSLAMLAEIVRAPDPPPVLVVVTARKAGTADAEARLAQLGLGGDVRHLALGPLSDAHSRQLARSLWGRAAESAYDVPERLLEEAGGHPLFIDVLVRNAALDSAESRIPRGLEAAMRDRIGSLEEPERSLLELMALATRALRPEALARGANVELGVAMRALASLRAGNLARSIVREGVVAVEPYHDRVRDAALAGQDAARRRELHERIALALEALDGDAYEALATHWRGAEDAERAVRYTLRAAEHASGALAFDQAARLYQRALEDMTAATEGEGETLVDGTRVKLAQALVNAGRGYEAAGEYQRAAARAPNAALALDLSWRAAAQLLQSGHIDESTALVRYVLRTVGLRSPGHPLGVLVTLLYLRLVLWVRGVGFVEKDESQISARELTRLDVCWAVSLGMTMVDMMRGFQFSTRYLLLALKAGEPLRIVRGLVMEMVSIGGSGWRMRARIERLEGLARSIAARVKSPNAQAWLLIGRGSAAYVLGDFKVALDDCTKGEAAFREGCVGVTWEINTAQHMVLHSLAIMGQVKRHAELHAEWRRSAVERGDLYADTNLRIGDAVYPQLAADDPRGVKDDVAIAMKRWSTGGFHLEHYNELFARVSAELYLGGDYGAAHDEIVAKWPAMRRSLLLELELLRVFAHQLRGRAALAAAQHRDGREGERLRDAERSTCALERIGAPWGTAMAVLLRAGIAHRRGEREKTVSLLARAAELCAERDMELHAVAARWVRGRIVGGDEGKALVDETCRWASEQTIKNPPRMFAVFATGFDDV